MGSGAVIVGGNGSGKTTLGALLAGRLGWKHLDVEDFYFVPSDNPYARSRTRQEVQKLLLAEIQQQAHFIFSAVNGDLGSAVNPSYGWIIVLDAPLEIRLQRVRERSIRRFGSRALPGGDLYEQEHSFWQMVRDRKTDKTERWVQSMTCPVLRLDGARPAEENAALAEAFIRRNQTMARR